jgi:hypothetical protein
MIKKYILLNLLLLIFVAGAVAMQPDGLQEKRGEGPPEHQIKQRDWKYSQRAYPLGYIPWDAYLRAFRQTQEYTAALLFNSTEEADQWVNIGPASIQKASTGDRVSGRITTIAVDPSNPNHWLIGGALGGIWESTLTATSEMKWIPRTDDQSSLAMGAIVFAPSNPNIIYAGTGEATFWSDGYAGTGILKSIDGGKSWQSLAGSTFAGSSFCKIFVAPGNPDLLTAATNKAVDLSIFKLKPPDHPPTGIFKSTDGGLTWLQKLAGEATHLIGHPQNFNYQYAGIGHPIGSSANGLYRSLDGGENWVLINGPWNISPDHIGRVELAISHSIPDVVYVSIQDNHQSTTLCTGLWMTRNAWVPTPTWVQLPLPSPDFCVGVPDHEITVDPTDPNILYAGGFRLWRYDGASWQNIQHQVHEDQHAMAWAGNRLLLGNDGGIYSTTDGGNTWYDHNTNLSITQFYKGSIHPNNSSFALGGNQDNGAVVTLLPPKAPVWDLLYGGDGFDTAISTTYPDTHWAFSLQMMGIFRTTDGAKTFAYAANDIVDDNIPFMTYFEKCPANDDVFIAATYKIWKSDNFFSSAPNNPSWYPNSMDVFWDNITALAFAPSDSGCKTYAFTTYHYAGSSLYNNIFLTTNGGQDWIDIDPGKMIPQRYITGLAFDQANASILYITLSGFDEGTPGQSGHVFKTLNASGGSPVWSNVSPPVNIPHNAVATDPIFPGRIYTGTDIGVWKSNDGGSNWIHSGPETGMPNVAVYDLAISQNGLIAFTHGRGAFQRLPQKLQLGADPGLIQKTVAANQFVDLMINTTNSHGDTPVYEWFLLTASIGGSYLPLYLISDRGFFAVNQVLSNIGDYTYSFDKSGVTSIGTMSMSNLGLTTGDTLFYGYAYMNPTGAVVIDNIVSITVN